MIDCSNNLHISGGLIMRNTLLNIAAKIMPLAIGVVSLPIIIRGLGTEGFGLLSLTWSVIIYFTLFDLGLGKAITKYVAEALGQGKLDLLPSYVWTTVLTQTILGLLAALILIGVTPLLTERVLQIPSPLMGESKQMLYILALSIPLLLVTNSFRGVLEAAQRFDLITLLSIPASSSTFLCPLLGVAWGWSLSAIVGLIVVSRVPILLLYIKFAFQVHPVLSRLTWPAPMILKKVLTFGGWLTVTSLIMPFYAVADRFFIGSIISVSAVAYYSASADLARRLGVFSTSLAETLFPAFSALEGGGRISQSQGLFRRAVKFQILIIGLATALLLVLAEDILCLWLGSDFAREGTRPLQIVALGVFVNSAGWVPFSMYMGIGRSDWQAKFHLIMLPLYLLLAFGLTRLWGISGAAVAVSLILSVSSVYNFWCTYRLVPVYHLDLLGGLRIMALLAGFTVSAFFSYHSIPIRVGLRITSLFILIILNLWLAWKFIFDDYEKSFFKNCFACFQRKICNL